MIRYGIVLSAAGWGFYDGGIRGVFYTLMLLGIVLWLLYTILDAWHSVTGEVTKALKPQTNVTNNFNRLDISVGEAAMRGTEIRDEVGGYVEARYQRSK